MVNQMPEGFETSLEIEATNYLTSTFMQRLNLTRALLVRPRVLLLDRIDESMDNETLGIFISLLEKLKGKIIGVVLTVVILDRILLCQSFCFAIGKRFFVFGI